MVSVMMGSLVYAERVRGHYKKDGTYVEGYYRTQRDNNPYNNMSYPGNYNYNTGKTTKGNQETYLENSQNKQIQCNNSRSTVNNRRRY